MRGCCNLIAALATRYVQLVVAVCGLKFTKF